MQNQSFYIVLQHEERIQTKTKSLVKTWRQKH